LPPLGFVVALAPLDAFDGALADPNNLKPLVRGVGLTLFTSRLTVLVPLSAFKSTLFDPGNWVLAAPFADSGGKPIAARSESLPFATSSIA